MQSYTDIIMESNANASVTVIGSGNLVTNSAGEMRVDSTRISVTPKWNEDITLQLSGGALTAGSSARGFILEGSLARLQTLRSKDGGPVALHTSQEREVRLAAEDVVVDAVDRASFYAAEGLYVGTGHNGFIDLGSYNDVLEHTAHPVTSEDEMRGLQYAPKRSLMLESSPGGSLEFHGADVVSVANESVQVQAAHTISLRSGEGGLEMDVGSHNAAVSAVQMSGLRIHAPRMHAQAHFDIAATTPGPCCP